MGKPNEYTPPYTITSTILHAIEEIGEALGRIQSLESSPVAPQLRRDNRIKTIQASLEIEGNTLNLDQVTAVVAGKRVLGHPREVQEVQNALDAYDNMAHWSPYQRKDLLAAHRLLMAGLVDRAGRFRTGNIGIQRSNDVLHIAPPAEQVPSLIQQLLNWLKATPEHPLVASCVFHYEFEFIHPFQDGNGRMGRLWQTVILTHWKSLFSMLPVESIIRDRQKDYYAALRGADQAGQATVFIEFMLDAIGCSLQELARTGDQVSDQVSDQVKKLLSVLKNTPLSTRDLMDQLDLAHRPSFRKNYLRPALDAGLLVMTHPESPNAHNQQYRLTEKGKQVKQRLKRR